MVMLTAQQYEILVELAKKQGMSMEVVNASGQRDLVGPEAGSIIINDHEYGRLLLATGYRPYADHSNKYQPNGSREMLRRQRRMK